MTAALASLWLTCWLLSTFIVGQLYRGKPEREDGYVPLCVGAFLCGPAMTVVLLGALLFSVASRPGKDG